MNESLLQMKRLGSTSLLLTVLGLGTLTVSPAQNNLSPDQAGELIAYAVKRGINWLDTADYYNNYDQIKAAFKHLTKLPIIMTKTYDYSYSGAMRDFEKARKALGVEKLSAMMLHEQESPLTLKGHQDAFLALLDLKERGLIDAVGVSTHAVSVAASLALKHQEADYWSEHQQDLLGLEFPQSDISLPACYRETDFIFPLLNRTGIGLLDGSWQMMEKAAKLADQAGLGVLGMKIFAGGHLLSQRLQAVKTALSMDYVTSWSVGMGNHTEVDVNIDWFCGREPSEDQLKETESTERKLVIEEWCVGCASCVKRCKSQALSIKDGQAVVDRSRCILCSYCAASCPYFAIKVW